MLECFLFLCLWLWLWLWLSAETQDFLKLLCHTRLAFGILFVLTFSSSQAVIDTDIGHHISFEPMSFLIPDFHQAVRARFHFTNQRAKTCEIEVKMAMTPPLAGAR